MTPSLLPELERAIHRQADVAAQQIARRKRRRARAGGLTLAGALAVSGGAYAAGLWEPTLGTDRTGHPSASFVAPPDSELGQFAVLRRAQDDRDRSVAVTEALRELPAGFHGVRTAWIRRLGDAPNGSAVVLVPAESGSASAGTASEDAVPDALCLWIQDPQDGGGIKCVSSAAAAQGELTFALGTPTGPESPERVPGHPTLRRDRPLKLTVVGLAPDDTTGVRLTSAGETQTLDVDNNSYAGEFEGSDGVISKRTLVH